MSTEGIAGVNKVATVDISNKISINMHIRKIDNGFILSIDKNGPEGYESAELAVTSLPKLLRAIATFLKEEDKEGE